MFTTGDRAAPSGFSAGLLGWTALHVRVEDLQRWRKEPGQAAGRPLPANVLRHAEEQTLAALWALQQTLEETGTPADLENWGVLAGTHLLGRAAQAQATQRFLVEGAWGISPHLIPHHSPHAPSGTISQLLGLHGPNLGICAGPHLVTETLAAALLFQVQSCPGFLLTLTRFRPEFVPSPLQTGPGPDEQIDVLALAFRSGAVPDTPLLTWRLGEPSAAPRDEDPLNDLIAFLAHDGRRLLRLPGGLILEAAPAQRAAA